MQYIKTKLSRIVEWYNTVELSTQDCEKLMLAKEKTILDEKLQPIILEMTWDTYDKEYIENTFDLIKSYYDRVMKAQENIEKIVSNLNALGVIPLFVRKDNTTDALLDIGNREWNVAIRLRRLLQLNRMAEKVVMDENYRLYFNVPLSCPCSSDSEKSDDEEDDDDAQIKSRSRSVSQRQQTIESLVDFARVVPFTSSVIDQENAALYLPYQEYVDEMVGQAIMAGIHTR